MRVMNAVAAVVVLLVVVSGVAEGCREELISFSECLAYVSYPPNNLTESASEKCCEAFSLAVESVCLCYIVRDPLFLGFPLNNTRLLSLSSLCPSPFSTSFPFRCTSDSFALPPLTTTPTETIGTYPRGVGGGRGSPGGGGGGGRGSSGSRGKGGPSGRQSPFFNGGGGTVSHHHSSNASSSSTLTPHITFLIFLAILHALLNSDLSNSRYSFSLPSLFSSSWDI